MGRADFEVEDNQPAYFRPASCRVEDAHRQPPAFLIRCRRYNGRMNRWRRADVGAPTAGSLIFEAAADVVRRSCPDIPSGRWSALDVRAEPIPTPAAAALRPARRAQALATAGGGSRCCFPSADQNLPAGAERQPAEHRVFYQGLKPAGQRLRLKVVTALDCAGLAAASSPGPAQKPESRASGAGRGTATAVSQ